MPTVSSTLKMFDQFSQPLQCVTNQVNAAVAAMGRLHSALQMPAAPSITLSVDMAGAMQAVERFKEQVRSAGDSAIQVVIDAQDISQKITRIQNQIRSGLTDAAIRVTFDAGTAIQDAARLKGRIEAVIAPSPVNIRLNLNASSIRAQINSALRGLGVQGIAVQVRLDAANALRQASALRAQIISRIGTITARLNLELPDTLTNLLTGLQRLVNQLIAAIQRLRLPPGGGGGGGSGGEGTAGWLSNLKGIAAAYLSIAGAQKLLGATIGGAMEQQKMMDMFIARTSDAQIGTAMFDKFKADALAAGQDVNKSLQSTLSFFSATQNVDQLTKLNNLAQRLNAFDSAGNGIEGAAFALKEAMSGDIVSLAERFNMSKADIRAFKIDELGKSGDIEGFIKAFDKLLEKQRMGQEAFDAIMKSPAKQMEILGNNMKSAFADAGGAAVKGLLPLIVMFNAAFQAGKLQPFFDMLSRGLEMGVQGLTHLIQAAQWLFQLVNAYGPEISAMLLTWGASYLPALIAKLWAMVPPLYTSAVAWLAINWPILAAVAAIGLVVFALRQFGVTTEQMVGFAIAIFYTLFAMIYNSIAHVWNYLLAFAEFLGNVFIDPVYAIKKLFYDMIKNVIEYFGSLIGGIIDGINWVIGKINSVSGKSIEMIGKFDASAIDQFKPTTDKDVFDLSKYKMNQKDLGKAFQSGYSTGAGWLDKTAKELGGVGGKNQDILAQWDANAGGIPKVGEVGEVGKIRDTVDISNEDLKVMRDLAEFKNIQNFVTLTPTVQVTTGDIHQEMDVDKMLRRIEEAMAMEIARSAEGVYR